MTDFPQQTEEPKRESKWLARLLFVALAVTSIAGVIWLATTLPPATSVAAGEDTTTSTEPIEVSAPTVADGDEPIADAAEKILPSVVQIQTTDGVGSGVVFGEGLILTAAHVVEGETTVQVRLEDGENVQGTVLGGTSEADIAVVQIDRTDVPVATLALDYTPRVGQTAIAVGSPWGLTSTVTAGIISAVNQPLGCNTPGGICRSMLQTDAAINPGNSGGPLVDADGRVVGINAAIHRSSPQSEGNVGIGFAVPANLALRVARSLIETGKIEHPWIGVMMQYAPDGVGIQEVYRNSPAEAGGIQRGDVIKQVNDRSVSNAMDVRRAIYQAETGQPIRVTILRDGNSLDLNLKPEKMPDFNVMQR
jgi:S1-C subfamily serine protease